MHTNIKCWWIPLCRLQKCFWGITSNVLVKVLLILGILRYNVQISLHVKMNLYCIKAVCEIEFYIILPSSGALTMSNVFCFPLTIQFIFINWNADYIIMSTISYCNSHVHNPSLRFLLVLHPNLKMVLCNQLQNFFHHFAPHTICNLALQIASTAQIKTNKT